MIVLDAFAVVAFLLGEPAGPEVARLLSGDEEAALTALGLAEVVDRMVRGADLPAGDVVLDLAELRLADPAPITADITLQAGLLRARHYHRTRCAVSLADCVVVATARSRDAAVATSDPHLLDVCHAEGLPVVVLPDTAGQRWRPSKS